MNIKIASEKTLRSIPKSDHEIYTVAIERCRATHNEALEMVEKNHGTITWLFTFLCLCVLGLQVLAAWYTFASLPFPVNMLQIIYYSPSALVPLLVIAYFGKHDLRCCRIWRKVQNHFAPGENLLIEPWWIAIFRPVFKISLGMSVWATSLPFIF